MSMPKCLGKWWGWVVVTLASVQWGLSIGPAYNYHIFLLSFQKEFHTNTAITGWVGSIAHALNCLGTMPAVALIKRLSPRTVILAGIVLHCGGIFATAFVPSLGYAFLTYGAAVGFGTGFIMQGGISLALDWIPTKYCARAFAMMSVGTPGGMLISGPLLNKLISAFGWRHTFMIVSSVIFVISAFLALFMTTPPPMPNAKLKEQDRGVSVTTQKLTREEDLDCEPRRDSAGGNQHRAPSAPAPFCRRWDAWLWFAGVCVGSLAWNFHAVNLASFIDSIGLAEEDISLAVVVLSVGQIAGTVLISVFGDSLPCLKMYVIAGSFIVAAVLSGFLTLASTLATMLVFSFLFGMLRAGFFALFIPSCIEIFSDGGDTVVSMLALAPFGTGILIAAPLSGGLYDLTGDYTLSLLVLTALLAFSSGCMLLIPIRRKISSRLKRRREAGVMIHDTKYAPINSNENITDV